MRKEAREQTLSHGMEKKGIIKALGNLDKFIVKGTVKKGREGAKSKMRQRY